MCIGSSPVGNSMKLLALMLWLGLSLKTFAGTGESGFGAFASQIKPGLYNNFLFYNKENGAWEETSITLTYFENLVQPFLQWDLGENARFRVGAGFLIGMNQEEKVRKTYPYIQNRFYVSDVSTLDLGSLDSPHDFPAPILDPLIQMTPNIRLGDSTQVPITYESYPFTGKLSHGMYEYGVAYRWDWAAKKDEEADSRGELYINWQLPDTSNHRERFDIGFSMRKPILGLPWYAAAHYWHNGGHENPHVVEITENYTGAVGLRNDTFNLLALGSMFVGDRGKPNLNYNGLALYGDYRLMWGKWFFQPILFVSDELRNAGNRYFSVEGDPFFRVPFYFGINFGRQWEVWKNCVVDLRFVNGFFQRSVAEKFNPSKARYDQMLRFQVNYVFGKD